MDLSEFITTEKQRIIERWSERVVQHLDLTLDRSELIDHLPELLDELVEALEESGPPETIESAERHGEHRMRLGVDIATLVDEVALVGDTILELAGTRGQACSEVEVRRLMQVLDRSIVSSVRGYAALRDQEVMDLTVAHRQRIEQERSALQALFARTPIPTLVLRDPDLRFEMVNPAYQAVSEGADVIGRSLLEVHPELREQGVDELLREVLTTGEARVAEEVRLDGTFWTLLCVPMRRHDDSLDSILAILVEVTEQVVARQAIRESERRYRTIFENAGVSIWEKDFSAVKEVVEGWKQAGVRDLRQWLAEHPEALEEARNAVLVVDVNTPSLSLFGAGSKEELLAARTRIFIPESGQAFVEELVAVSEGRASVQLETPLGTLGGNQVDVVMNLVLPKEDPSLSRVLMTVIDITARKQAEQALRESDRRKDEFLAMLGHELRNPLAAIRSASDLVQRTTGDDPRLVRASDVLGRRSEQMTRLIDGLLEITRITRGKITLERRPTDLRGVLAAVLQDRGPELERYALQVTGDLGEGPVWVSGDPVRLVQVFDNLLGNAIKYTPAGGRVGVVLREHEGQAVVTVSDTGVGISAEMLPRLFEPFQQDTRQAVRASDSGLGLGLALARGLVDLHGGRIEARSEGVGSGTELEVGLPLIEPPPEVRAPAARERPEARRVLVVEDNTDAAQMLRDVLELEGHHARVATSGPGALEVLRAEPFDLVLCDIGMPEMNGYEVARAIRADPALRHLHLVALTGFGQPEDRRRSLEAGFDEHLVKPVDLDVLDQLLCQNVQR